MRMARPLASALPATLLGARVPCGGRRSERDGPRYGPRAELGRARRDRSFEHAQVTDRKACGLGAYRWSQTGLREFGGADDWRVVR